MDRFVIISGCSGGGKSTLLVKLGGRGNAVVESIGRTKGGEGTARGGIDDMVTDLIRFIRMLMIQMLERSF